MPQKEAQDFTLIVVGGVPTKLSRSRQFRGNFASGGGTSGALLTGPITKSLSARDPFVHQRLSAPDLPTGRAGATNKSALGSRSCGRFCPEAAVDTPEPHDKLEKRKRCTNSMSSALFPLFTKRGGTPAEFTAKFPQKAHVGANADGAAG